MYSFLHKGIYSKANSSLKTWCVAEASQQWIFGSPKYSEIFSFNQHIPRESLLYQSFIGVETLWITWSFVALSTECLFSYVQVCRLAGSSVLCVSSWGAGWRGQWLSGAGSSYGKKNKIEVQIIEGQSGRYRQLTLILEPTWHCHISMYPKHISEV